MPVGKISASRVAYPAAVVALGLQPVWNLRYTAGVNAARSSSISANGTPAGWSSDAQFLYSPAGTWSLSNWNVDAKQMLTRGDGTYTNCYFNNSGWRLGSSYTKCVAIGGHPSATTTSGTFNNCTFDGTGMSYYYSPGNPGSFGGASILSGTASSTINLSSCAFRNTPLLNFKTLSTGTTTISRCYFGTFGYDPKVDSLPNSSANSHMEQVFMDGGTWNITECLFDASGYDCDPLGQALTGQMYAEAYTSGNLVVNFTRCIIRGASLLSLQRALGAGTYWMQFAARGPNLTVTFTDCVIDPGIGRVTTTAGGGVLSISGSGNLNLLTGASFSVAYP